MGADIRILDNTACGDACCCFAPPEEVVAEVTPGCNLVLELVGPSLPAEPLYEFNEGRCPHPKLTLSVSTDAGDATLQVLGRCGVWEDPAAMPAICRDYPRNTNQVYCDYEKNLWSTSRQIGELGCGFTLYYGFRDPASDVYGLDRYAAAPSAIEWLIAARDDRSNPLVKAIDGGWLLVRVPTCGKVCAHLPPVEPES